MELDFSTVEALLPVLLDLTAGRPVAEDRWEAVSRTAAFPSIMHNCCVAEEGARPFTLAEWRGFWETAAHGQVAPALGQRQRYLFENVRDTLGALPEIQTLLVAVGSSFAEQMEEVLRAKVLANLPTGATVDPAVFLILGSASGGFYNENGMYFDLNQLRMLRRDPALLCQFLAHEIWHTGHSALAEQHPDAAAPWFIQLYMLQSEGIVNCLIGGTREWCEVVAGTTDNAAAPRERAYLEYLATMDERAEERLGELAAALEKLLAGDKAGFQAYTQTLPDHPGYLHGVYMAQAIERGLGREALLTTLRDPVSFIQTYQAAARAGAGPMLPESLITLLP